MPDGVGNWFWWVLLAAVGLPVVTVALTELNAVLVRRRSSLAGPVQLLRTYVLPLTVLLVLLTHVPGEQIGRDGTIVKIAATVLGFLILMFVLSGLNAALFLDAARGSWRERMPSIFIDLTRVILIATGLAVVFSVVWGTDIGGLFAALGVTSIVLGFALQNAVGSIVSGLLLLFEQPFRLGDWLDTGSVRGRVVEVNWRAVHIITGNGIQIVPNAALASASFTNLSRPTSGYVESIESTFSENDPPLAVIALLNRVADGISLRAPSKTATSTRTGAGTYLTSIPLNGVADVGAARAEFNLRIWYAARRADLRLNDADVTEGETIADVTALLRRFAPALHVEAGRVDELAAAMTIERYAAGEVAMRTGELPDAVRYLAAGEVSMNVTRPDGSIVPIVTLGAGDYFGQTTLTRTPTVYTAIAGTAVTTLVIPRAVLDELVRASPPLARDYGAQIEHLRQLAADTLGVDRSSLNASLGVR